MLFRRKVPLVTLLSKISKGEEGQGTAGAEPDRGHKEQQEFLQLSQPGKEDPRKNSSLMSKTGKLVAMGEQKTAQLWLCRQQHRSFRASHTYPTMVRIPQTVQFVSSRKPRGGALSSLQGKCHFLMEFSQAANHERPFLELEALVTINRSH